MGMGNQWARARTGKGSGRARAAGADGARGGTGGGGRGAPGGPACGSAYPLLSSTFLPASDEPPIHGTPMRSSSSSMPTSPMMYTFFPLSLNFVCSRYAAAANDDEKISSAATSSPRLSNFFL